METGTIADLRDLVRLFGVKKSLRQDVQRLGSLLESAAVQVEGRVGGSVVGRIGADVQSRFWRLFGLPNVQFNPLAIAKLIRQI